MNNDEAKLVKMGMEVALRPVTEIASDLLGLAGGDYLREARLRNRKRLQDATADELKHQNVQTPSEPSPSIAIPLLSAAQDESRDEMVTLWAKLLAAAMNPATVGRFRRVYIDLLRKLEPADALILKNLGAAMGQGTTAAKALVATLGLTLDEVLVSFQNLIDLELATNGTGEQTWHIEHTRPTPLGNELVRLLG